MAVVFAGLHRHNRDMAVRFHLQEQRREVRQEEDGGLLRAANQGAEVQNQGRQREGKTSPHQAQR